MEHFKKLGRHQYLGQILQERDKGKNCHTNAEEADAVDKQIVLGAEKGITEMLDLRQKRSERSKKTI